MDKMERTGTHQNRVKAPPRNQSGPRARHGDTVGRRAYCEDSNR